MRVSFSIVAIAFVAASIAACFDTPRNSPDSAAGIAGTSSGNALSLVDVDMGRHIGADRKISDATDDFAPADTIYASVHTSGKATGAPVTGRWIDRKSTRL